MPTYLSLFSRSSIIKACVSHSSSAYKIVFKFLVSSNLLIPNNTPLLLRTFSLLRSSNSSVVIITYRKLGHKIFQIKYANKVEVFEFLGCGWALENDNTESDDFENLFKKCFSDNRNLDCIDIPGIDI